MGTNILLYILLVFASTTVHGYAVMNFTFGDDLIVWLYSPSMIRVSKLPPAINEMPTLQSSRMVEYCHPEVVAYNVSSTDNATLISTEELVIQVDSATHLVSFYDKQNGNAVLSETQSSFTADMDPALNTKMYDISQEWQFADASTSIFGFGSQQNGILNYRDQTVRCVQFNTEICIPMLITSGKYGIFWDNNGVTTLNNKSQLITPWTVHQDDSWYNLSTAFTAKDGSGAYSFFIDFNDIYAFGDYSKSSDHFWWMFSYSMDGGDTYMAIEAFGVGYTEMPSSFSIPKLALRDSQSIQLLLCANNTFKVPAIYYRYESDTFDIQSLLANYIDYYFIHSSAVAETSFVDDIVGQYRLLTGGASPLYALSVYGFWHSQNTFPNQQSVLDCAAQYRQQQYPVDNIVQDFYYWGDASKWGPQFDIDKYPNPSLMVQQLHEMHFQFMISVWPQYGKNTSFYSECAQKNYLISPTEWLNVYRRDAASVYYTYINETMFSIDVDYIWADSTEPDNFPNRNRKFVGNVADPANDTLVTLSGNALMGPYSKYVIQSLAEGYSKDYPQKRMFALTRSGTAGQEKYGSTIWTGDISNDWDVLRRQIAASINYAFSGNNYWANDMGGFYRYCSGSNGQMTNSNCYDNIAYHRLMIRWFQVGVFQPLYRVHGYGNTAPYNFGPVTKECTFIATNLRYRLLPYIYSMAYLVRYDSYTMQRGLLFDFYGDGNIYNSSAFNDYEFMFGPFLLIAPLFDDTNGTSVYLPTTDASQSSDIWWDFWTGETLPAAQTVELRNVPLQQLPIYVKGGSILILGPIVQYATERAWDVLEVRVYGGADGSFILFEDDFVTANTVDNGQFTLIAFKYQYSTKQLVIGARIGSYSSMLPQRVFNVTLVSQQHGIGVNVTSNPTKSVTYNGQSVTINL